MSQRCCSEDKGLWLAIVQSLSAAAAQNGLWWEGGSGWLPALPATAPGPGYPPAPREGCTGVPVFDSHEFPVIFHPKPLCDRSDVHALQFVVQRWNFPPAFPRPFPLSAHWQMGDKPSLLPGQTGLQLLFSELLTQPGLLTFLFLPRLITVPITLISSPPDCSERDPKPALMFPLPLAPLILNFLEKVSLMTDILLKKWKSFLHHYCVPV